MLKELLGSEHGRRVAQQVRLIYKDFPWLWAVRNHWFPGAAVNEIVVRNAEWTSMRDFLLVSRSDLEIWVRIGATDGSMADYNFVIRIEPSEKGCWLEWIKEAAQFGHSVYNVVVITPLRKLEGASRITIYRGKELNRILS